MDDWVRAQERVQGGDLGHLGLRGHDSSRLAVLIGRICADERLRRAVETVFAMRSHLLLFTKYFFEEKAVTRVAEELHLTEEEVLRRLYKALVDLGHALRKKAKGRSPARSAELSKE
jgi:hypothetical protein